MPVCENRARLAALAHEPANGTSASGQVWPTVEWEATETESAQETEEGRSRAAILNTYASTNMRDRQDKDCRPRYAYLQVGTHA